MATALEENKHRRVQGGKARTKKVYGGASLDSKEDNVHPCTSVLVDYNSTSTRTADDTVVYHVDINISILLRGHTVLKQLLIFPKIVCLKFNVLVMTSHK